MERKRICCLRRIGENGDTPVKHLVIPFDNVEELVIGRAEGVDVCIPSDMISRRHAIFTKGQDGAWTVKDNKSLNGIFINDIKIKPEQAVGLKDQDILRLGVPRAKGTPPEFVWKFYTSLKVKVFKNKETELQPSSQGNSQGERGTPKKRKHITDSPSPSCSSPAKKPALKRLHLSPKKTLESPPSDIIQQKLAEQEQLAQEKIREQEKKLAEMQALLQEKEKAQESMFAELKKKEVEMKKQMERQKVEMEAAKKKLEKEMREQFAEQLKDKEDALVARLVEEQQKLIDERNSLEERLNKHTKNAQDQKELEREKQKLDKVIQQKELEQKMLESQLKETQTENVKQKQDMLKIKEDILHNFADLMETELQCAICNELFVFATSLPCSHSYCELCIEQWMETKKICPVCRAPIKSHFRSIALDSYIDKMVEHLSDEMKENRKELVAERKAEQEKKKKEKVAKSTTAGTSGRGGRRGRGGRAARAAAETTSADPGGSGVATRATRSARAEAIVVASDSSSDDTDSSSDSDSDSDASVEGYSYYGGYGRCFSCGRRGHWASGCPY